MAEPGQRQGKDTVHAQLRKRNGFTLVEILIVVVIVGILAGIAMIRWHDKKVDAFVASMKSDLYNLAVAQEAYYGENQTYASDLSQLGFRASTNVVVTVNGTQLGWAGTASHPAADGRTCALFYGNIAPEAPAVAAGIIKCD
jgi:prepilin-type N-terminal cleavage/methylation domain-containing protein